MHQRLLRLWKYAFSFLKADWSLRDFPVRVREFTEPFTLSPDSHLKPVRWTAQIIGWPTVGGNGDTREGAMANLAEAFQRRVASGKPLPRPGTECLDLQLAATDRLGDVEHLAPRFFNDVIGINYDECLITDESSLWDFHTEADNESFFERIVEVYGLDVRDIESGNIVEILERIRLLSPSA